MEYLAYSILGVAWLVFSVIGILALVFSDTWWELIKQILIGMKTKPQGKDTNE